MKVVVNDEKGIVTYADATGLSVEAGVETFGSVSMRVTPSTPVRRATHHPINETFPGPGVYRTDYDGITTWKMPLAATYPGSTFVIRADEGLSHSLTGSLETPGTRVFTDGVSNGSRLTFTGTGMNRSVALLSDGASYLVMASSGSFSLSGT